MLQVLGSLAKTILTTLKEKSRSIIDDTHRGIYTLTQLKYAWQVLWMKVFIFLGRNNNLLDFNWEYLHSGKISVSWKVWLLGIDLFVTAPSHFLTQIRDVNLAENEL